MHTIANFEEIQASKAVNFHVFHGIQKSFTRTTTTKKQENKKNHKTASAKPRGQIFIIDG